MKTQIAKVGAVVATIGAAMLPAFAFAQSFSTTTAQTSVVSATNDLGAVLATVIPVILGILVALLALGMGIRYVRKHVSGRKF